MTRRPVLALDGGHLTIADVAFVANHPGAAPVLDPAAKERMVASRAVVDRAVAADRPVYGVTTGFGRFSDVAIAEADRGRLQVNLIESHSAGVGEALPAPVARAMVLLRANALAKGFSGARPVLVERLLDLLTHDIVPEIPRFGSVGASGDLAPLSHLALVLTGRGFATWRGERMTGAEALAQAGLAPVVLEAKEGLALINGTQMMTAYAALIVAQAETLLDWADRAAALTVDVLRGIPAAFDERVAAIRPHPGHALSARHLREALEGSRLITHPGELRVQDAYSLRCIPQIHGASRDALVHIAEVVEREINSATDNPLIFADDDTAVSAGNFHGQPVALVLDYLAIALAELADVSERRIERMVNPALSGLPPFLVREGGLNSGLMVAQYTAAALVSQNKVLAHPASVDSIPTSANQEDHVSMGSVSAVKAHDVLRNVTWVIAAELICGAQAAELVGPERLGQGTRTAYDWVRQRVAPWDHDRVLSPDLERVAGDLANGAGTV
ncbi:MAG: histidine ammonia-lyase [Thermaerobacter sp.]|nr:histidine ammonia-lyase [Thermaerobacter sp.]